MELFKIRRLFVIFALSYEQKKTQGTSNKFSSSWAAKLDPPMPKDVYDLLTSTQKDQGRRHFRRTQQLYPRLVSAWPQCPPQHCPNPEPKVSHQFKNSWASKLHPPMPKNVYDSLSKTKQRQGQRHFSDHKCLHPDIAKLWPNCPTQHLGNSQPKLGRPVDPASEWHQLRQEFPLADDAELKRKQAELKKIKSRIPAHAQTKVQINVDALQHWLSLFNTSDRRFIMARKVLRRALANPTNTIINIHWRRFGIGRMYAGPWASLASMDRSSRAVALIGVALLDLDMNNAHPRIALMLARLAGL